jgi:hypothetical protein
MAMYDGTLRPGDVDDKIPCLHHWFSELTSRAKRLEMPLIELLTTQTVAAAKRWAINEMRKPIHTKLYGHKRRKASNKQIKKDFFHDHLRHLKQKKIKDMTKLLKGTIRQLPNELANQYVLRFCTQVGEADCGNYASDPRLNTMLCFFFREGLLPHLRKYAHSDDNAQPFVDLDVLINHMYGKEDDLYPYIHEGFCRVTPPQVSETFMFVCRGHYGSATQTILIDTGAPHSVISERAFEPVVKHRTTMAPSQLSSLQGVTT